MTAVPSLLITSKFPNLQSALRDRLCKLMICYPYAPGAWHIGTFNTKRHGQIIEQLKEKGIVETLSFESISPELNLEIVNLELELHHEREDFAPGSEPDAIYLYVPFRDGTAYTTKPLLW